MVPTSPVRSQPLSNFAGSSSLWYAAVTHGPRTSSSPTALPSLGSTSPESSTMRPSTPKVSRPAVVRESHAACSDSPRGGGAAHPRGGGSVLAPAPPILVPDPLLDDP